MGWDFRVEKELTGRITGHLPEATDAMLCLLEQVSFNGVEVLEMLSVQHGQRATDPPGVTGVSWFVTATVEASPATLFRGGFDWGHCVRGRCQLGGWGARYCMGTVNVEAWSGC